MTAEEDFETISLALRMRGFINIEDSVLCSKARVALNSTAAEFHYLENRNATLRQTVANDKVAMQSRQEEIETLRTEKKQQFKMLMLVRAENDALRDKLMKDKLQGAGRSRGTGYSASPAAAEGWPKGYKPDWKKPSQVEFEWTWRDRAENLARSNDELMSELSSLTEDTESEHHAMMGAAGAIADLVPDIATDDPEKAIRELYNELLDAHEVLEIIASNAIKDDGDGPDFVTLAREYLVRSRSEEYD